MSLGGCCLLLVARTVVIQRSRWRAHARQGTSLVSLAEDVHDLPQPRSNPLQSWCVIRGGDAGTEEIRAAPATPAASTTAASPDSAAAFEDLRRVRSSMLRLGKTDGFYVRSHESRLDSMDNGSGRIIGCSWLPTSDISEPLRSSKHRRSASSTRISCSWLYGFWATRAISFGKPSTDVTETHGVW